MMMVNVALWSFWKPYSSRDSLILNMLQFMLLSWLTWYWTDWLAIMHVAWGLSFLNSGLESCSDNAEDALRILYHLVCTKMQNIDSISKCSTSQAWNQIRRCRNISWHRCRHKLPKVPARWSISMILEVTAKPDTYVICRFVFHEFNPNQLLSIPSVLGEKT